MSSPNDDQLHRFRLESDRAFRDMQACADREMAMFLSRYGQQVPSTSGMPTPSSASLRLDSSPHTPPTPQAVPVVAQRTAAVPGPVAPAAPVPPVAPAAPPVIAAPVTETFDSFSAIGEDIKGDLESVGRGAIADAKGWLRTASMDLGARAKREAEAMREAAQRVMQEEKSLRGLKQRAQQELQEAKSRMKSELTEMKGEALTSLEGIAVEALGDAQQHGRAASDAVQKRAQLELEDIWGAPKA